MREVRIRFSKTGKAKYISHLDMTRCFSRAFFRTGIPLWFTEGFNPRPYMNFTMPLTLGAESVAEALDIRLEDESMTDEEVVRLLGGALPSDIKVLSAAPPVHKMNAIKESRYRFTIEPETHGAEELAELLAKVAEEDHLLVEKSGKKGKKKVLKTIDLKDYLKDFSTGVDEEGRTELLVTLPSSPQFGVNPRLFLDKFLQEAGEEPLRVRMMREALYCDDNILFE